MGMAVRTGGMLNRRLPFLVVVLWLAITAPASAVDIPIPPQDYTLPSSYVSVSNGSQLASALAAPAAQDIVLEDGTYDTSSGYFQAAAAHRLWGRTHPIIALDTPGPILTAGLSFGGNDGSGGGEVHGLTFDISDPRRPPPATPPFRPGARVATGRRSTTPSSRATT